MIDSGFIKLSRKFFDNKIWQAARAFSECEAWIDLIQSARFEASPTTSRIGCYEVTWGRGQYPASNRFLAKKWGRSEQWTKSFLGKLKRENMITTDNGQGVNIITLVNFERYNGDSGGNTGCNPPSSPLNRLENNDLEGFVTHLVTHLLKMQPTSNPNNKNEEDIKKPPKGGKENPIPEEMFDKSLDECYSELLSNSSWAETLVMNKRASGHLDFTMDGFQEYLKKFFDKLQNEGETHKSPKDAMSHFSRWVDIVLKKPKPDRYKQENEILLESVKTVNSSYYKFLKYVNGYAPYCFANMKMPTQEEVNIIQKRQRTVGNGYMCRDALSVIEGKPNIREKWDNLYLAIIHQFEYQNGS